MIAEGTAAPDRVVAGTFSGLSLTYCVEATTAAVADAFARFYAPCATRATASVTVVLESRERQSLVRVGRDAPVTPVDAEDLLLVAMTEIDRATVAASRDDALILHASAAVSACGPVVLVGPSGAGKSTLSAALTAAGWTYLGDEAIGIQDADNALCPNPKPWKLDRRARVALAELSGTRLDDRSDRERLVAIGSLGRAASLAPAGAPVAVVAVQFVSGAGAVATAMSQADVAEALADQCFNFAQWGGRGLDVVAAVARRTRGLRLVFGDLAAATAALDRELQ